MSAELKTKIAESLQVFHTKGLYESSMQLFQTLGYDTSRTMPLKKPTWQEFEGNFINNESKFDQIKARVAEWNYVDLLFQLTRKEITDGRFGDFEGVRTIGDDKIIIETYLFFTIELTNAYYSRTSLSTITREVNNLFSMPAMILFKHGNTLTLSIINRRIHRRDENKDVLEKVTLIKDISVLNPHRGHLDILSDLSLSTVTSKHEIADFVDLHNAWQKTLDTKILNKRFFQELSNWYFWAQQHVWFPADKKLTKEKNIQNNLIRLLTRMIFVWFLKEKGLVPSDLFEKEKIKTLLKSFDPNAENKYSYYQAILQNLFFGTLNQQMSQRAFVKDADYLKNKEEHGVKNKFRYAKHFTISENEVLKLFDEIPFLNGGLFDCLDKDNEDTGKHEYIDGFSREASKAAKVPDILFFGEEQILDLSEAYGYKRNKEKCRGLFNILNSYKFTIEENTPIEEEIALDPELLGKVFENLLAYYNPETETTARKQTGSFYTPREIVNYMVDESLIAYLKTQMLEDRPAWLQLGNLQTDLFGNKVRKGQLKLEQALHASKWKGKENELEENLRKLIAYTNDEHPFTNEDDIQQLIYAIDHCKILDPACGSGAFPMGILHKLVYVLGKLDENNTRWKELQKRKTQYDIDKAIKETDKSVLHEKLEDITQSFEENASDYGRKLYLIENCIYGVDKQPIAVQISKLRFFISLVVDQKEKSGADNRGIRPLPNLETKFVAANTLIGLDKPAGLNFRSSEIIELENQLKDVRHQHFEAKTRTEKQKFQKKDKAIRKKIAEQIKKEYASYERSILVQIEQLEQQLKLSAKANVKEVQKKKLEKARQDIESKIYKLQQGLLDKKTVDNTADKIAQFDIYNQNEAASWFEPEWMFGKELENGFDVVIGNPPYIQLQNNSGALAKELQGKGYETFERTGDIYTLFYEKGFHLLKQGGHLIFITSNKWMRAGYGESTRNFLSTKTDPTLLIDFSGQQVFDSATVDTNILLFKKSINAGKTKSCIVADKSSLEQIEHFVETNHFKCSFYTKNSWVILNPIEQRIKEKIEEIGTPLKEWNVQIYRGILTGLNEAFIIDGETRKELIKKDKKSAEIIRPILRGRDIKRYSYDFADLWLINSHNGTKEKNIPPIQIDEYSIIKKHLNNYYTRLVNRDDQGDTPYNLRNCAYMEDFSRPKIIWKRIGSHLRFSYDDKGIMVLDSTCFATGEFIKFLVVLLNSAMGHYLLKDSPKTGTGDLLISVQAIEPLRIPKINSIQEREFNELLDKILMLKENGLSISEMEEMVEEKIFDLYNLDAEERNWIIINKKSQQVPKDLSYTV